MKVKTGTEDKQVSVVQYYVNNTQIKKVESYIYLGQRYNTKDKNQDHEIQR